MSQWCNKCGKILTPESAYSYEMLSGKKCVKKTYMSNVCKPCKIDHARIRYNLLKLHPRPPSGTPCECCGRVDKLNLDHDWGTENFRGWVCKNCNIGLGHLGDNFLGVERALQYLKRASLENGRRHREVAVSIERAVGKECVPECPSSVQVSDEAWIECSREGC